MSLFVAASPLPLLAGLPESATTGKTPVSPLNLLYDVARPEDVSVVATEAGLIPVESVPVLLRDYKVSADWWRCCVWAAATAQLADGPFHVCCTIALDAGGYVSWIDVLQSAVCTSCSGCAAFGGSVVEWDVRSGRRERRAGLLRTRREGLRVWRRQTLCLLVR